MAKSGRYINTEPTPQNLRALWDQLHTHTDLFTTNTAEIATLKEAVATLQSNLSTTQQAVMQSHLALRATQRTTTGTGGGTGFVDDGFGAQGCASCGVDGHVAPGTILNAFTVGQIVCGTANEFPALVAPAVDQPTRDANMLTLLLRMIWHLNQAGFTAGRQRNPSGVLSGDKLAVQSSLMLAAYDVTSDPGFASPIQVHCNGVGSPNLVADPGTPD